MILYRPVGLQELTLIYDSGMKAFPARLPQQPIFYPVLELEYARQTASGWNAQNGQFAGYVTEFRVEDEYIAQFEKHTVGPTQHQELWIPAEEVDEFNKHIQGHIKVVEAFFGDEFQGFVPDQFGLQAKNAVEQFTLLTNSYLYKRMEFYLELKRNHKAVFLNYPFWHTYEFKNPGLKEKVLQAIKEAWLTSFPKIPLPNPVPKDIPPVEQSESHSSAPVPTEVTPRKQTDSRPLRNPVREKIRPVKQINSQALVNPVHEEVTPEEQTESDASIDPVEEYITPAEQTDSRAQHWIEPVEEEIELEEETDSDSLVDAIQEEFTPAKQINSPSFVKPVREATPLPTQADPHFVQGVELGLSGEYHEALEELSQAVEENPDDVVAQTSLGVAFHRLGEDDRALNCYETALRIDPIYAEAHYFRANVLYSQGNVREAIAGYSMAIGLQPELIEAHRRPEPQDRLTDYTSSPAEMHRIAKPAHRILQLNKLLESNPKEANLFKERAAEYYRLGNYAQAIADYSSALALQPQDASALHSRGLAYEELGQHDRALADYQQAIAIDPQLSSVYLQRGVTQGKAGNFRQSIASLTEGIRLAPKNPDGYFNRGTSYFQLGDLENAIADFSITIELSPNDEDAYYWRGVSYEEAGRQSEARSDYRRFLTISQNSSARKEIEQKLSQWNVERQKGATSRTVIPENSQKTQPLSVEKPDQNLDLYALVAALGERALNSTWFGTGVECYGEKAEQLYAFTEQDRPIRGRSFHSIAEGIRQTIRGDFQALDPGVDAPWIFIRAWEGSGFYVETNDPKIKKLLKAQFPSIEEVDGASPSYEGLFLRV